MGSNALSVASPGQDIPSNHHNELVEAFLQNVVPRDASRVAVDLAGSLGTSALRWLRAYVQTYHIGTASNNLIIYEGATGEIWIQRNDASSEIVKIKNGQIDLEIAGVKKFSVTNAGIDWATQANKSIPFQKVSYTAVDVPLGNANGQVVYTAPVTSLVFFVPYGPSMEDDAPVGLYIENFYVDSDGGPAQNFIHYSQGTTSQNVWLNANIDDGTGPRGSNTPVIIPAGKSIKRYITDSSDKIGGTLYVFPLG